MRAVTKPKITAPAVLYMSQNVRFDFLKEIETRFGSVPKYTGRSVQLPEDFWEQRYFTINDDSLELAAFRGKYLFMAFRKLSAEFEDFWGELYVLQKVRETFPPDQLEIIIFIAFDEQTDMQLVAELKHLGAVIPLTDPIQRYFDLTVDYSGRVSFENLFISPEGKAAQTNRPVNRWFFHKRIR